MSPGPRCLRGSQTSLMVLAAPALACGFGLYALGRTRRAAYAAA